MMGVPTVDVPSRHRLYACTVAVFALAAYYYFGTLSVAIGLFVEPYDKLAHFAFFASIGGLLSLATGCRYPLSVLAAVSLIGVVDEWRQSFLPGRSADPLDLFADVTAAIAAVLLSPVVFRMYRGCTRNFNQEK